MGNTKTWSESSPIDVREDLLDDCTHIPPVIIEYLMLLESSNRFLMLSSWNTRSR